MSKFIVSLSALATADVEIEAPTPEEAARLALEKFATIAARPVLETVCTPALDEANENEIDSTLWDVVGACEACGMALLVPSPEPKGFVRTWGSDPEGILAHFECPKPAGASS